MNLLEETLRNQRDSWREIAQRVSRLTHRDLPPETPKRILLFGVGSSLHAAKLTAYSLLRDKYRSRIPVLSCASHEVGLEVIPTKGDWALAFTHRGTTEWTRRALELCARSGVFPVQVSAQGAPELAVARLVLSTSLPETVEPHTVGLTGAVCAVTSLLSGAKAVEEWDALHSVGDPDLDLLKSRVGKGPTILLGEWEGEWLAREAALKLMEIARIPVRCFGSEEFFHGPKFSVGSQDSIWHISVAKEGRGTDLENLARSGEIQDLQRIEVSGASPLAWIPGLVRLQWMALAVGMNRGCHLKS